MKKLELASIPKRILANIIDMALVSCPAYLISSITHGHSYALFLIFLVITCCYHTYMYMSPLKASVGQKILGIFIAARDGTVAKTGVIFNRTISQFLCPTVAILLLQSLDVVDSGAAILSMLFLFQAAVLLFWSYWYAIALFSKKQQTLHDKIYNTVVLAKRPKAPGTTPH
ncbi:MAG: RDD family protein [Anaplasma ovis]|uniref:RDD family protein n=1 Tax=Anaplasma ovis str. Haibei TaxID=1248439 RepID=A0A2Z2LHZ8_9RICK|nr:RDD family protein [Anaplasma ovis]ASI47444.1 RDD family protein [Anaplasma ovis str. Haibei]